MHTIHLPNTHIDSYLSRTGRLEGKDKGYEKIAESSTDQLCRNPDLSAEPALRRHAKTRLGQNSGRGRWCVRLWTRENTDTDMHADGVGKSSIITSLIKESFVSNVSWVTFEGRQIAE
jgi:hypothetical protein